MTFQRKGSFKVLAVSALHALWLIFLSFLLLNWHFVHWDEGEIIQFGPILKKLVLGWEQKPPQEDLMFVNVSYDNQLVEITDSLGFPLGNERITDREKLSEFLNNLAAVDNYKALVLDIRFDLPSGNDAKLVSAFAGIKRTVVSNHLQNGIPEKPVIPVKSGISDYPVVGGSFFKFQYFYNDTVKTVPLLIDEIVTGKKYVKKGSFFSDGTHSYYNIFLADLLVRPHDIFIAEDHYFYENLGNILYLDSASLAAITKDKIIVVGDFEKYDKHETLLGEMPGPLILLNTWLSLSSGQNRVKPLPLIFLFISYTLLSLIIFVPGDPIEAAIGRISGNNRLASAIAGIFSYFLLLILTVLFSYLLFDMLLNVLWLTFYLYVLDKVVSRILRKKEKGDHAMTSPGIK